MMSPALNEFARDATASPGQILRPRPMRCGGTIFLKVEEIVFEVPRYRLAEHSEVFETMFNLPAGGDGTTEGRDEEHPVILESYKAVHFDALLKIIYPTADDLISGSFQLEKDEWIGVLNLSTMWSMKKIRKHAIKELCKISLNPMEKIALGREHKVAKWFQDGLTELVSEHPIRPLAELKSQLGSEMACTLLWIQNQTLQRPREGSVPAGIIVGMLGCFSCQAAMFPSNRNCYSCSQSITVDDRSALYAANWSEIVRIESGRLLIDLKYLMCGQCSKCAFADEIYTCPSCSFTIWPKHFSLRPVLNEVRGGDATQDVTEVGSGGAYQKILEEFGDEIAGYESWDQELSM